MTQLASRSAVFCVAVILCAAAAGLGGCGGGGGSEGTSTADHLRVAYEADATTLDPGQATDINTMHVLSQMYDTLVKWDSEGKLVPALATEWVEAPDRLSWTFKLRRDVKFSDGTPLTAEDVAYTFNRMLQKGAPGAEYGPYPIGKFLFGFVSRAEAKSDYVVKFHFSSPFGEFLSHLTTPIGMIVNSEVAESLGKQFAQKGSGTGPFMLARWQRGSKLVLEPNPHYWGPKPTLKQITWSPVTDASQRVTNLRAGDVDLAINPQASNLPKLENDGFKVSSATGPHIWWVGLNVNKPPLDNVKVRRAMNYAIDRKSMVEDLLFGTAVPAHQPIGEGEDGHGQGAEPYAFDVERAKTLMKEAGYADGFSLDFAVTTSGSGMQEPEAMGTAIQAYLGAIGIKVKIQEYDWGTFLSKVVEGAGPGMDMWEMSWMNAAVDPTMTLEALLGSKSCPPGFNTGCYSNPEVDKLLKTGAEAADRDQRMAAFEKASLLINQDAPWIFIDHGKAVYAHSENVQDLKLNKAMPFLLTELDEASVR